MILEKQTEANVLVDGQAQESIGMSLDLDSAQILMQMLSKNLYSDDVGSAIRECASNALDSHRRAGVDEPIIVSFKPSSHNTYEFSVEDFGIGLDDEDVRNIISKYGKSTKRNSATELGMMGLGFKAPLAYSSSFYFVCRKNGVERKYMMYEGEDTNTIDLLYEKETTERNGVKVIIPVKYFDKDNFFRKIKEQLCYFENVYFDVPGDNSITNDFSITRHEHFQFSELSTDSKMHICLDDVYYPLDFEKLGIKRIDVPVGLRFSLTDGIYPTPNRESIRYTKEAKDIILKKIKDVADYFVNMYNESIKNGDDITSVVNYLEKNGTYVKLANGETTSIDDLVNYSSVQKFIPKLKGLNLLDFNDLYKRDKSLLLHNTVTGKYSLRYKRFSDIEKSYCWAWRLEDVCNKKCTVYIYEDKLPLIKKEYIKSIVNEQKYHFFVKNVKPMKLGIPSKYDKSTYYHFLNLKSYPKHQWREVIKEYQYVTSLIIKDFINLDDIIVPQDFIDSRKKVAVNTNSSGRRKKLQGEVFGKEGVPLERWSSDRNCKFVPVTYNLEKLSSDKFLRVYGHHDDYLKLDALYGCAGNQKIKVVTFSDRDLKIIKEAKIHNMISYEEFMSGKSKPFKRIATAHAIKKLASEFRSTFDKLDRIAYSCYSLSSKLKQLHDYIRINYSTGAPSGESTTRKLLDEMLAIAQEKNLFDGNIHHIFLEVEKILTTKPFINAFSRFPYYNEKDDAVHVFNDLFKYHKFRINLEHYKLKQ